VPRVSAVLMNRILPNALLLTIVSVGLIGCGYHLVRAGVAGSITEIEIGAVEAPDLDESSAVRARSRLRSQIKRRGTPALVQTSTTELTAIVSAPTRAVIGFGENGVDSVQQTGVKVELKLSRAGHVFWTSGPVTGEQPLSVGGSAYETENSRKRAIEYALDAALDAALIKFYQASITPEARS